MDGKKRKDLFIGLLFLAVMAACWLGAYVYQMNRHALPGHVDTLAEFAAEMPGPERVAVFEKGAAHYVEVTGPRPGFPAVPSGRPAYIFDSGGRVRYWTIDTGDAPEYWEMRQERANSREVSLTEALKLVQGTKH